MKRINIKMEGAIKLAISIGLLVLSIVATIRTGNKFIMFGMAASTLGDFNIMNSRGVLWNPNKDNKSFAYGMICFSIAHLMYVFAMGGHKIFVGIEVLFCVLIIIMIWGQKDKENFDPLESKVLQVLYAGCIITAAVNALFFFWIVALGYVLFISSDLTLSILEKKDPRGQIAIWALYAPGQVLIISGLLTAIILFTQ